MEKKYSREYPQKIVEVSQVKRQVNYYVWEVQEDELNSIWEIFIETSGSEWYPIEDSFRDDHKYGYYSIELPYLQWSRDGIINAIIRDKYRIDEMEAITNNMAAITAVFMQTLVSDGIIAATKYLKDSINDDNTKRFKEMQEWRAMAKKVASEIIKE